MPLPKDGPRHERFPYEESYREGYTAGWFLGRVVFIVLLPIVWPIAATVRFNQRLAKLLLAVLAIAVTYLSLDVLDRFFLNPLRHYIRNLPVGWLTLTLMALLAGIAFGLLIESIPATIDLYRKLKQIFLDDPRSKLPKSVGYHLRHGLLIAARVSVSPFVFTSFFG